MKRIASVILAAAMITIQQVQAAVAFWPDHDPMRSYSGPEYIAEGDQRVLREALVAWVYSAAKKDDAWAGVSVPAQSELRYEEKFALALQVGGKPEIVGVLYTFEKWRILFIEGGVRCGVDEILPDNTTREVVFQWDGNKLRFDHELVITNGVPDVQEIRRIDYYSSTGESHAPGY